MYYAQNYSEEKSAMRTQANLHISSKLPDNLTIESKKSETIDLHQTENNVVTFHYPENVSNGESTENVAPRTLKDVQSNGKFLGKGSYGTAYKIGESVYKIYHDQNAFAYRSARYWNKIYNKIYDGKYKALATATATDFDSHQILITPFIAGASAKANMGSCCFPFFSCCYSNDQHKVLAELSEHSFGMLDTYVPSNVKKTLQGDLVPVDFDLIFQLDRETNNEPLSPSSQKMNKYRSCCLFATSKDKKAAEAISNLLALKA